VAEKLIEVALGYGPWGLLVAVLLFVFTQEERTDRWRARFLDLFAWAGASWRRRAVKAELQAAVNIFARSMNSASPGVSPFNLRIEFVDDIDRAEMLLKHTILVRIRDRRHDDRNLVHATLAFCPVGVIPAVRQYLPPEMSMALDLTVTRALLADGEHYTALEYLSIDVAQPIFDVAEGVHAYCTMLDRLNQDGLLTRVVLREFRAFGAQVIGRLPTADLRDEPVGLVRYLDAVATREPGEEMPQVAFKGRHISLGFVFVGTSFKLATEGSKPYLRHIERLARMGDIRAYLVARGANVSAASYVAREAENNGLGKTIRSTGYSLKNERGERIRQILIEFLVADKSGVVTPDSAAIRRAEYIEREKRG
jgi:small subunit ribosomal protein S1